MQRATSTHQSAFCSSTIASTAAMSATTSNDILFTHHFQVTSLAVQQPISVTPQSIAPQNVRCALVPKVKRVFQKLITFVQPATQKYTRI